MVTAFVTVVSAAHSGLLPDAVEEALIPAAAAYTAADSGILLQFIPT
jgi:hypothetical protein